MIRVPVTNFSGSATSDPLFVEFNLESLPKNCQPVINLLARERVSIEYWLEVAVRIFIFILPLSPGNLQVLRFN